MAETLWHPPCYSLSRHLWPSGSVNTGQKPGNVPVRAWGQVVVVGRICCRHHFLRRDQSMSAQSMLVTEEIHARVARVLTEILNVDEGDITPSASLRGDLGAESIDFLDILFQLEREFGIDVSRDELFPESIFQGDPELVQDGRVTDKGLAELRTRMPFADLSSFE